MKKNAVIFLIFGFLYCLIEILFRGYTYPSMLVVGGFCGLLIGLINDYSPSMNLILQMLLGTIIVTIVEFITGYILNITLGLNIWDYSNLPYNVMGQICLQFSCCWFILSYFVIKLDDLLRLKIKG